MLYMYKYVLTVVGRALTLRRQVYEILTKHGVEVPKFVILNREEGGNQLPMCECGSSDCMLRRIESVGW